MPVPHISSSTPYGAAEKGRFPGTLALLGLVLSSVIVALGPGVPAEASGEQGFKLPWTSKQAWTVNHGPDHQFGHSDKEWDFNPAPGAALDMLAMADGTARVECLGSNSANVEFVSQGETFLYRHLDRDSVAKAGITESPTSVQQGQLLGSVWSGTLNELPCGESTGTHLHLEFNSGLPITIDGYTFTRESNSKYSPAPETALTSSNVPLKLDASGGTDFNGDGKSDVLGTTGSKWIISYSGTSNWKTARKTGARKKDLLVGDFNGDGKSDVLGTTGSKWIISHSGTSNWKTARKTGARKKDLLVGDFNGDGKSDVLGTTGSKWIISYSGTSNWKTARKTGARKKDLLETGGD